MKRILPVFLFAILTQTAVSQDAVYDRNTDTTAPRKVIRLKKYSYDDPQLNKIAAIEILPVQWDTTRLGFVQVGLANKKIEALPASPYEGFLQDYIHEQYGSSFSPAGAHNKAIFMSALFGGAAGAVIASGATQISVVTAIPYITKQQPEATALDMITGELTL